MQTSPVFRELRGRLRGAGLPAAYVRRYLRELRDHHAALIEECLAGGFSEEASRQAADARLGEPRALSDAALRRFRRRTFTGRHAWFFHGVAPPFVLLFSFILILILLVLAIDVAPWQAQIYEPARMFMPPIVALVNYGLPWALAAWYWRAGRRRALALVWRILPIILIVLAATFLEFRVRFASPAEERRVALMLGAAYLPRFSGLFVLLAIVANERRRRRRAHWKCIQANPI